MNINWLNRFKNKATLTAFIAEVIAVIYFAADMFGYTISIPSDSWIKLFGLIIAVLITLGIVVDPNTKGVGDSELAMSYPEPRDDNVDPIKVPADGDEVFEFDLDKEVEDAMKRIEKSEKEDQTEK